MLDFSLSPAQQELRDGILAFAQARLNDDVIGRDRAHAFPRDAWDAMGEHGLLGLSVPTRWGGLGLDALTTAIAVEALGEGCTDGGLVFSAAAHLFAAVMPLVEGGSDAREAAWHRVSSVLSGAPRKSRRVALAFDHEAILGVALERLRARALSTAVAFRLLPREFTLSEAQRVHEIVLGHSVDKVTFRRRLAALSLVRETPRMRHGPHRPARLYVAADL